MADIKCPKCGGVTTVRTAKNDSSQFYVCVKYPECDGMVPAEEDWGADWDKGRPLPEFEVVGKLEWPETPPPSDKEVTDRGKPGRGKRSFDAGEKYAVSGEQVPVEEDWSGGWGKEEVAKGKPKRDKRRVDAGVKKPENEEAVPVEEDWSGGWGAESPHKATHFKLLQRRESSPSKVKVGTTASKSKQAKRGVDAGVKEAVHKEPVAVEEDWSGGWGTESPAPELAKEIPQQRKETAPTEVGKVVARKPIQEKRRSDAGVKQAVPRERVTAADRATESRTEIAATKPVQDQRREQQEVSIPKAGAGVSKSAKAQRKTRVITRTGRQGRAIIDKGLGIGEEEKPVPEAVADRAGRRIVPRGVVASRGSEPSESKGQKGSKVASYAPQYKRLPNVFVVPEEETPSVPPQRKLVKRGAVTEVQAALDPKGQRESKSMSSGSRYRRRPKPSPVLPQEPEKPKPTPYKPLYQRPPRWEVAPEDKESSEIQDREETKPSSYKPQYRRKPKPSSVLPQEAEKPGPAPYRPLYQKASRWETPSEEKAAELQGLGEPTSAPYRPQYRRKPKPAYVPPQEPGGLPPTPYRPQYPRAQKRAAYSGKQEAPKPRRRKAK